MSKVQFTAVYDWLARRKDLNPTQTLIVAHILRYGHSGCFKSNSRLAHDLGLDRVTLIRALKVLIKKEWVAPLYPKKRERILYINEAKLDDMPLFAEIMGCGRSIKTSRQGSGALQPGGGVLQQGSGAAPPPASGAAPLVVNRNSKDLSYTDDRVKKEVLFLDSVMKERKGMSKAQFECNKQKLLKQCRKEKT